MKATDAPTVITGTFHQPWVRVLVDSLALVAALGILLKGVQWVPKSLKWIIEQVSRLRLGDPRHRAAQRASFIRGVILRLELINLDEEWTDRRYAELEAEVEAEGPHNRIGILRLFLSASGPRRVRSLSRALVASKSTLIQLQGDPGSGKSVALRHLAIKLATRARKSTRRPVPLYVNLKEFRSFTVDVTGDDVRRHVLNSATAASDERQVKYLREVFDDGVSKGKWIFLFDSFDEIPAILAAVEVDATVKLYASAIAEFLGAVEPCRGVLASREYRGPRGLQWPCFQIVPLSERKKAEFVRKASLDVGANRIVRENLSSFASIRALSDNPMFLGLICEYVEQERSFPETAHAVFESHVRRAVETDDGQDQLAGLSRVEIRKIAERAAFCMSAEAGLGLSASIDDLTTAMQNLGFAVTRATLEQAHRALQYIRLARSEHQPSSIKGPPLTFSHRRLQEYFATCFVLENPSRVTPLNLLLDGRWRETAVTVLQMHPPDQTQALLSVADELLDTAIHQLPVRSTSDPSDDSSPPTDPFPWPQSALHVLGILDAGLSFAQDEGQRQALQSKVGKLLLAANTRGLIVDQKWALDVVGPAPEVVLLSMLRRASHSGSSWLRETAFRQIARLRPLPEDIAREIYSGLLTFAVGGRLRREYLSIAAQLRRLETPAPFLRAQRLLIALPFVDFLSLVVTAVMLLGLPSLDRTQELTLVIVLIASHAALYAWRATVSFAWSADQAVFPALMRMLRIDTSNRLIITPDTIVIGVYGLLLPRLMVVVNLFSIVPARGLFCFFLLSWAPIELLIVRQARLRLPYSLLVPQLWVVGGLRHALGGLLTRLRAFKHQRGILAVVLRGIAFLWIPIAFIGLSYLIMRILTVGRIAAIVVAVGLLGFALVAGIGLCLSLYHRLRDRWRLWRLRLRTPSSISAAEFVSLVLSFATPARSIGVLYALRSSRVFAQSPQATPALLDLALSLEYSRWHTAQLAEKRKRSRTVGGEPWWRLLLPWPLGQLKVHLDYVWPTFRSSEFTSWVRETGSDEGRKKMQSLGADFLDELGRGLEQANMPEAVYTVGVLEAVR